MKNITIHVEGSLTLGEGVLSKFEIKTYSNRKLFVVFFIFMVALIVDQSISQVADIVKEQIVSIWGIALFVVLSTVYVFGQYLLLELVKAKNRESGLKSLHHTEKIITIVQYILISIVILVVLQILIFSQYYKDFLIASSTLSYGMGIVTMGILGWRLFFWFRVNRRPIILLYGLAAAFIVINAADTLVFADVMLADEPSIIYPSSEVIFEAGFEEGSFMYFVYNFLFYTQIVFIFLLWGGTIFLLYHNVKKVGTIKFWILVVLFPLVYFSTFISVYEIIFPTNPVTEAISSNFMIPILLFAYSGIAIGVLFGLGFLSVARSTRGKTHAGDYMFITCYGFILSFSAFFATVTQTPYPPYGLPNVSSVGLSFFMILVGLYYSAISVAQDVELRRSIKKSIEGYNFLDSIGTAHIQQDIENKVTKIAKDNSEKMTEETEIQPNLTELEVKSYLDEVINEIRTRRGIGRA